MNVRTSPNPGSQDALLAICLFAAFADGEKSAEEREEIRRLAEEIGSPNLAALSRQILMQKLALSEVIAGLTSQQDRLLAYEMALGICEAGGSDHGIHPGLTCHGCQDATRRRPEIAS